MRSQTNRAGECNVFGVSQVRIAAITIRFAAALRDTVEALHWHLGGRSRLSKPAMRLAYLKRPAMALALRPVCTACMPQAVGRGG